MMSLFDALGRLYHKNKFEMEDFHTEIVAQVLRNSDELTLEWLRSICATTLESPVSITIRTQEKFDKLEENQPGSRVDMVVRLIKDGEGEIIFIESKIDSTENPGQLEKYAGVIAEREGFAKKQIVYITRDFEIPRPPPVITTRWFKFYHHLKAHTNGDGLARELKLFMEENKMTVRNQFTAIDSLALGQLPWRESSDGRDALERSRQEVRKGSGESELRRQMPFRTSQVRPICKCT